MPTTCQGKSPATTKPAFRWHLPFAAIALCSCASTTLVQAIQNGDDAAVRARITKHDRLDEPDRQKYLTPLCAAIERNSPALVRQLLDAGASPTLKGPNSATPLCTAAEVGNERILEMLIDRAGPVDQRCAGLTPLWLAANRNNADAVAFLLKHGAAVDAADGRTPLMVSVGKNRNMFADRRLTEVLLIAPDAKAGPGFAPVTWMLLDAKANVNAVTADGVTALRHALAGNDFGAALVLLERGADPNLGKVTPGDTATEHAELSELLAARLHSTVAQESAQAWLVTKRFVEVGGKDPTGALIRWAIFASDSPAVYLKGLGGDAILYNTLPIALAAIQNGVGPNVSLLGDVIQQRRSREVIGSHGALLKVADVFLQRGGNVNVTWRREGHSYEYAEHTPLTFAVQKEDAEMVELLLKHHADMSGDQGRRAREIASERLARRKNPTTEEIFRLLSTAR